MVPSTHSSFRSSLPGPVARPSPDRCPGSPAPAAPPAPPAVQSAGQADCECAGAVRERGDSNAGSKQGRCGQVKPTPLHKGAMLPSFQAARTSPCYAARPTQGTTCCQSEATLPGKPRCRVQSSEPMSTPSSSALVAATARAWQATAVGCQVEQPASGHHSRRPAVAGATALATAGMLKLTERTRLKLRDQPPQMPRSSVFDQHRTPNR